jgi:hypothetical protein
MTKTGAASGAGAAMARRERTEAAVLGVGAALARATRADQSDYFTQRT